MKDMGRYGNIAFCALVLYYCSIITVAQVPSSPTAQTSVRRGDDESDFNMTSSFITDQTESITNQTNLNSTVFTSDTNTTTGLVPENHLNISLSENITDSPNRSDASPVNTETTHTTVTPTTLLPSATHDTTSEIQTTAFHPTSPDAKTTTGPDQITVRSAQTSSPTTTTTTTVTTILVTVQTAVSSSPVQAKPRVDSPSVLNVKNDVLDIYPRVSSDPLLAGLVSAFVFVAAIGSVLVFLKFRNRNNGPEFSRLQDLPMDDMLEDAPLSMYGY